VKEPKFKDHYCPVCLWPVDENTGDHWVGCEYEAGGNDADFQPLNRKQMLVREVAEHREEIAKLNRQIKAAEQSILACEIDGQLA